MREMLLRSASARFANRSATASPPSEILVQAKLSGKRVDGRALSELVKQIKQKLASL